MTSGGATPHLQHRRITSPPGNLQQYAYRERHRSARWRNAVREPQCGGHTPAYCTHMASCASAHHHQHHWCAPAYARHTSDAEICDVRPGRPAHLPPARRLGESPWRSICQTQCWDRRGGRCRQIGASTSKQACTQARRPAKLGTQARWHAGTTHARRTQARMHTCTQACRNADTRRRARMHASTQARRHACRCCAPVLRGFLGLQELAKLPIRQV